MKLRNKTKINPNGSEGRNYKSNILMGGRPDSLSSTQQRYVRSKELPFLLQSLASFCGLRIFLFPLHNLPLLLYFLWSNFVFHTVLPHFCPSAFALWVFDGPNTIKVDLPMGTNTLTLPKAQRTRGLSSSYQSNFFRSYHKFLHKS